MLPKKPTENSLTLHGWIIESNSPPPTHTHTQTHCSHPLALIDLLFPVEASSRDQVWNCILRNELSTTRGCLSLYWFPSHRVRGLHFLLEMAPAPSQRVKLVWICYPEPLSSFFFSWQPGPLLSFRHATSWSLLFTSHENSLLVKILKLR